MRKSRLAVASFIALSFAIAAPAQYSDKEKIEALYQRYLKAFNAKDVNTIMAMYDSDELFVFDVVPPQEYKSWAAYKKDWEGLFAAYPLKNQI